MADLPIRITAENESEQAFDEVIEDVRRIQRAFERTFEKLPAEARKAAAAVRAAIAGAVSGGIGSLGTVVISSAVGIGRSIARGIVSGIGSILSGAFSAASGLFSGLVSGIGTAVSGAVSLAGNVLSGLVGIAGNVVEGIVGVFSGIGERLAKLFTPLRAAIGGLIGGAAALELAKLAGSFRVAESAATNLAGEIDSSITGILAAVARGSRGTLSELGALERSVQAISFGVVRSEEELEKLVAAARRLGAIAGIRDQEEAFERLTLAIGKQTNLRLDDFLLQVNIEKARADFVRNEKGFNEALSERERRLALIGAARRKLAENQLLNADATRQAAAEEREAANATLQRAIASDSFTSVLTRQEQAAAIAAAETRKLTDEIKNLTEEEEKAAFAIAAFDQIDQAFARIGGEVDNVGTRIGALTATLRNAFVDLAVALEPAFNLILDGIEPVVNRVREWVRSNQDLIGSNVVGFIQSVQNAASNLADVFADLFTEAAGLREAIGERLAQAFEVARTAGNTALDVLFSIIAGVRNEFEVFSETVRRFFEGRVFDPQGSIIIEGLRALKTEVVALGLEITRDFGISLAGIVDQLVIRLQNSPVGQLVDIVSGAGGRAAIFGQGVASLGVLAGSPAAAIADVAEGRNPFGAEGRVRSRLSAISEAADGAAELADAFGRLSTTSPQFERSLREFVEANLEGAQAARAAQRQRFADTVEFGAVRPGGDLRRSTEAAIGQGIGFVQRFGAELARDRSGLEENALEAALASQETAGAAGESTEATARALREQAQFNRAATESLEANRRTQEEQARELELLRARVQATIDSSPILQSLRAGAAPPAIQGGG